MRSFLCAVAMLTALAVSTTGALAQLSGSVSVPSAGYPTISSVIAALNTNGVGSGGVTINVAAGYTETISATLSLTATGTSANPITFQKSGTGANPLVTSYTGGTGTPGSATPDGIWRLVGSDYVTINGINLAENSSNTTNPSTMEYGYGLFKANATDGCQNNTIKNCVVSLNRVNDATGTAPMVEGSVGILAINSTPTAATTNLSITSAAGANSNNKFHSDTVQNCHVGIALIGFADVLPFTYADFNNDIGGSSLATGNAILNFGGAASSTTASAGVRTLAQYNLNVSYNTVNNHNGSGVAHVSALRGIYINTAVSASTTISYNTVTLVFGGTTTAVSCIENVSGATGSATSNTININNNVIQNCTSNSATSGVWAAIMNSASAYILNINGNKLINNSSANTSGTKYLINNTGAVTSAISISNDTVNMGTWSATSTSSAIRGIFNGGGTTGTTFTCNNNIFQNLNHTGTTGNTGIIACIYNSTAFQSATISNNTFNNLTFKTSTTSYLIYNSNGTPNITAANNAIATGLTVTATGSTAYGYYNFGSPGSGTSTHTGNNFSNITLAGTTSFYGIYQATSTSQQENLSGNTVSNITGSTGSVYGIYTNYGAAGSTVANNTVSGLSGGTAVYGITAGFSVAPIGMTVSANTVSGLSTSTAGTVYGLYTAAGTAVTFSKNKLYNLTATNAGSIVYGIYINGGTTVTASNNIIGDLTNPSATSYNAIAGIYVGAGTNVNLYYNTVNVAASSTAATFGTSALYIASTTPTLVLRNNIFVNTSTPGSTDGFTTAFRYASAPSTTFSALSNNNLYYGGTPASTSLIYGEGTGASATNGQQTLSGYVSYVSTRDAASISENPDWVSTTGSLATFLHIDPTTTTAIESGGSNIPGITDDFDNNIRQGNPGYSGSGTGPDIGADEFSGTTPAPKINSFTATPAGNACSATARTITANISPAAANLTSVSISYSVNGGTPVIVPMTGGSLSTTSTWTATIPAATPSNGTVTYSITVTDGTYTKILGGVPYADVPLLGYSVTATSSSMGACAGQPTVLNVTPGATSPFTTYEVASIPYDSIPTPSSGVTILAAGGAAVTTTTAGDHDDGYWTISLPFSFNFYGTSYTNVAIGTNGNIQFGTYATAGFTTWPTTSAPTGAFGALFGDLYANIGSISYFISGTAPNRVLVVNWSGLSFWQSTASTTPSVTVQGRIYEGSNVLETHILLAAAGAPSARLVGIQNQAGTSAVIPPNRNYTTWTTSTEAWQFAPQIFPGATYLWTPNGLGSGIPLGTQTQRSVTASPSTTTLYTVTVTDPNNCSISDTQTVVVNPLPTISVTPASTVICAGGNISLTANGGSTYTWSPSSTLSAATGATVTATPTGTTTYTITGSDANGCVGSTTKTVTVNPLPTITVSPSTATAICVGGNVSLTANGGSTYTWSPATGLSATTGTTVTASPTTTTTYTVTGTDINGCVNTEAKTVTVNLPPSVTITPAAATAICIGSGVTLTGNGAATYTWSPATGLSATTGTSVTASPTTPTTYTVTGTDVNGCVNTATKTVTVNALPTIGVTPATTTTICAGSSVVLTANGGSSYSWSPATGLSATTGTTVTASPATTTTYTVTGTDINGCVNTTTKTVSVIAAPTVTVSPATAVSFCIGGSATLTAGGTATSFTWSPATGLSATTGATVTASPTATTTYTITGTGAGGCTNTTTKTVTVNALPTIGVSPTNAFICGTGSVTLTANGATTYAWSPSTGLSATTGTSVTASPTATTTYTVTGTDINGCVNSTTRLVSVFTSGTASISPTIAPVICAGGSATLTATGGSTYVWSPATGLNTTTGATVIATPATTTTYTVTATNSNGCIGTATKTVTVNQLPIVSVSPTAPTSVCAGSSVTLTANGASTYSWTPAATLNTSVGATVTATPVFSTNYTVTGTDANGCVNTASKFVTVLALPTISITPFTVSPRCEGDTVTLTAFGASTYTWAPTTGLNTSTSATVRAAPPATTTYTVTGTAANGCKNTATRTVTIIPAPDPTISPRGYVNVCQGDSVYLKAVPGYTTYVWTFYSTVVTAVTSDTYPTAIGGYYSLTVTDNTGCSATTDSPTIITVISRPISTITNTAGTAILDAGAGFATYEWYLNGSAIAGATSRFHTATAVGIYTVRLTESSPLACDAMTPPYELRSLNVGGTVAGESIKLYPNPASMILRIEAPISVSATVTSMDGKQVFIGEAVREINISAWPDGIYRIVLRDKSGAFLKMEKITKLTQ